MQDRRAQLKNGRTLERHLSAGHFIQQHTEAPNITTGVAGKMFQYFRSQIRRCSHDRLRTLPGYRILQRAGHLAMAMYLRKTEIQQLDATVPIDHHISALEVTMA